MNTDHLFLGSAVLSLLSTGIAQHPTDPEIRSHVMASLLLDPRVSAADVKTAVADGFVTLTGTVDNLGARTFAVREAEKIAGVKGVTDSILIAAPPRTDTEITDAVRRRIEHHSGVAASGLLVSCTGGDVVLAGRVPARVERELATDLASEVRGVRAVRNDMAIDPTRTIGDQDIDREVHDALRLDVYLAEMPIQVTVADGRVDLRGAVGSWYDLRRAVDCVANLPGVRDVTDHLHVEWFENDGDRAGDVVLADERIADNVRTQLARDVRLADRDLHVAVNAGAVTLTGTTDSCYRRQIAAADARDTVGVALVDDQIHVVPNERSDDDVLADVRWELGDDPMLAGVPLDTKVAHGVVTLSGTLHTPFERRRAEAIAHRIRGVVGVVDECRMADQVAADAHLDRTIADRLRWDWRTYWACTGIHVQVQDGTATLTGEVSSWRQRAAADQIAYDTPGVVRVLNHLQVTRHDVDRH